MTKNSNKKNWLSEVLLFYRASPQESFEGKSSSGVSWKKIAIEFSKINT